ncbi:hypothetical protein DY000_02039021 [Brassica cretica]|uniref:Uncharacterized protein n=1 Tax=Brassica cretica TaxID=69181 RepID=A0ABQ7BC24_BRACR|nr:hypothetical protein DY000_02039021 [Brassica cretica]
MLFGGGRRDITIEEVVAMVAGDKKMPPVRRLKKLRQETKVLAGFSWALQLWSFEAIPGLLAHLGGNDEQTLLTYDGDKLPQHTGLGLVDVLDAEHDPKLTVQPMYEPEEDKEDGWGEFDSEIFDRKVAYMVGLVKALTNSAKASGWVVMQTSHCTITKKQQRIRKGSNPGAQAENKKAKVEKLSQAFASLEKVVGKQARILKKLLAKRKGKFSNRKLSGVGWKRREVGCVGTGRKPLFEGSPPAGSDSSSDEDRTDRMNETAPG